MKVAALCLLLVFVLLSACSPQAAPSAAPKITEPAPSSPVPVSASPVRAAWEVEWEKLLANARQEGSLVVHATSSAQLRQSFMEPVREKFGLRLEFMVGRGGEVGPKLVSERRAGLYLSDIYIGGSTTALDTLKPAGALASMDDVIILPEVLDSKAWYLGGIRFTDRDHKVLPFAAGPSPSMAINTNMVKPEEIKSYRNLLEPRWKGKIILNDPTLPGIGLKWFGVVGAGVEGKAIMGLDFMRELAKQEPRVLRDQRQQIEWLAQGKYPIVLAPLSGAVAEFIQAGATIQVHVPEEGSYLSSATGNVALIDRAAHPNAARVFINWLLTKEGQTLFSKGEQIQSGRLDVPTDFLPSAKMRDPKGKYIWAEVEDFLSKQPDQAKVAKEIFGHLMK